MLFRSDAISTIRARIRSQLSPRHVPDEIHVIGEVPRTLSGKKLEVPVKAVLRGASPDSVISVDSLANPGSLTQFEGLAGLDGVAGSGAVDKPQA